ncbi:MAG: 50S ribosomal protein L11 methyltransferase [Gammaproteobacteria bacterium]|nr:50S ribosomal protein L11 methyltransferase [Gammaproteobacteria bacterium]
MQQLRVQLDASALDEVEALLLSCGALSLCLEEDGVSNPIFEPPIGEHPLWPKLYISALFEQLVAAELSIKALAHHAHVGTQVLLETIDETDWQAKFQQQFNAKRYGKLWVYPSWQDNPEPEGMSLKLDPGLAFGTGKHPTTDLCLHWLGAQDLAQVSVLDFGCGSGILALAAAKLGAMPVVAIDIDPQALTATEQNRAANEISAEQVCVTTASAITGQRFSVVMANILAGPLLELRDQFIAQLLPKGELILSGILNSQVADIKSAYSEYFELVSVKIEEDWARIAYKLK